MKKREKVYKSAGVILGVILIVNLPPVRWFSFFYVQNYTYSSIDGNFIASESYHKGSSYLGIKAEFNHYLSRADSLNDRTLYRTFSIKPWRFWEWYQWFGKGRERFFLSYLSEEELRKNKGR